MWPVLFNALRSYAPYVTLPFAGFIGFLGYNLEALLSDKYTPYNSEYNTQTKLPIQNVSFLQNP